jgi:hypothetical protein
MGGLGLGVVASGAAAMKPEFWQALIEAEQAVKSIHGRLFDLCTDPEVDLARAKQVIDAMENRQPALLSALRRLYNALDREDGDE